MSNLEHGRDIEYVRDLGLIARQDPVRMANPIYAEVVPRELSYATQARLVQEVAWYVRPDGDLDVEKLMGAFQTFFREHSEHWPMLGAPGLILDDWAAWIYPPEVIKEHGDISDWRNLVGTGPMMLTDWTEGSCCPT